MPVRQTCVALRPCSRPPRKTLVEGAADPENLCTADCPHAAFFPGNPRFRNPLAGLREIILRKNYGPAHAKKTDLRPKGHGRRGSPPACRSATDYAGPCTAGRPVRRSKTPWVSAPCGKARPLSKGRKTAGKAQQFPVGRAHPTKKRKREQPMAVPACRN